MTLLNYLITIQLALIALLAWVFVIRYSRVDWRASDEGKHIMGFTICIAVITTISTEVRIFGSWAGIYLVAILLYGWLAYLLFSRNWLLYKAQREVKREEAGK